jgi:hypothetical protein
VHNVAGTPLITVSATLYLSTVHNVPRPPGRAARVTLCPRAWRGGGAGGGGRAYMPCIDPGIDPGIEPSIEPGRVSPGRSPGATAIQIASTASAVATP